MAAENRDHHASLQADDMRQFFLLKSVLNPMGKVVKGLSIDKHHESLLATPTTAGHKEGTMLEYTRRTEPMEKPSRLQLAIMEATAAGRQGENGARRGAVERERSGGGGPPLMDSAPALMKLCTTRQFT
jgi:hypothetical protein